MNIKHSSKVELFEGITKLNKLIKFSDEVIERDKDRGCWVLSLVMLHRLWSATAGLCRDSQDKIQISEAWYFGADGQRTFSKVWEEQKCRYTKDWWINTGQNVLVSATRKRSRGLSQAVSIRQRQRSLQVDQKWKLSVQHAEGKNCIDYFVVV